MLRRDLQLHAHSVANFCRNRAARTDQERADGDARGDDRSQAKQTCDLSARVAEQIPALRVVYS
mgnify:CR=1 FL=1